MESFGKFFTNFITKLYMKFPTMYAAKAVKKLLSFAASILLLSVLVFYAARLAPGDPLVSYYGDRVEKMDAQQRQWAEDKLGLNAPIWTQYVRWLTRAIHGDFGISYKYKTDVLDIIKGRMQNTLLLGGVGFLLIFTLALLLGVLCAYLEGRLADRIICRVGVISSCIPEFWLALLFILLFSVHLRLLPSSGAYDIGKEHDTANRLLHLALPLALVVLSHIWYYAYIIRNNIVSEIRADYVLLAKAKGLGRRDILMRHCLRNVLPSYFSLMAVSVPHILGGTYIIETVCSYPGLGTLSYESARYKDYNLLMVLCILSGALVMICSLAANAVNRKGFYD